MNGEKLLKILNTIPRLKYPKRIFHLFYVIGESRTQINTFKRKYVKIKYINIHYEKNNIVIIYNTNNYKKNNQYFMFYLSNR